MLIYIYINYIRYEKGDNAVNRDAVVRENFHSDLRVQLHG